MNLKRRFSKEVGFVGIIFAVLFMIVTAIFLQFSNSVNNIISQSEPALDALDLMLIEVYESHILLTDYLQTTTYAESLKVSQQISGSALKSDSFEENLKRAIATDKLTDLSVIENYQNAISLYEQVESFRVQLIALHERELVSSVYTSSQKSQVQAQYSDLLVEATSEFKSQISTLDAQNQAAKNRLVFQSRLYAIILAILLLICIGSIIYIVRKLSKRIISPLDETIDATKQFVAGDYEFQLEPTTSITEILDLQDNINAVFRAIREVAKSGDSQRKSIQKSLLKKEYVAILDYLAIMQSEQKKVTISDVKKHFQITHPTVLARITFLEQNGYIRIEKEGRDKCLFLE